MGNRCKVCGHPKRKLIDRKLVTRWRSTETYRKLARRYGLTVASLYRHLHEHIGPELWAQEAARRQLDAKNLLEFLLEEAGEVRRLRQACTEWLRDPEDPGKLTVDPRAEDVSVIYMASKGGELVKCRARLTALLARVQKKARIVPVSWTVKHPAPASVLVAAAKTFGEFIELAAKLSGQLSPEIDLEAVVEAVVSALRPHPASLAAVIRDLRELNAMPAVAGRN